MFVKCNTLFSKIQANSFSPFSVQLQLGKDILWVKLGLGLGDRFLRKIPTCILYRNHCSFEVKFCIQLDLREKIKRKGANCFPNSCLLWPPIYFFCQFLHTSLELSVLRSIVEKLRKIYMAEIYPMNHE